MTVNEAIEFLRSGCGCVDVDDADMCEVHMDECADIIEKLAAEVEKWTDEAFKHQAAAAENLKEIERLKAEVLKWKKAWKIAYDLYKEEKYKYVK